MKKFLTLVAAAVLSVLPVVAQTTHTLPATDTQNVWTGTNTFQGTVNIPAASVNKSLQALSGCTTPGYAYSPAANGCVSTGTIPAAGSQYAIQFTGSSANLAADNAIQASIDHSIITAWPKANIRDSLFANGWTYNGTTMASCAGLNSNASGYADPTGVQDSTCALNSAIAYANANDTAGTTANVYLPAGIYKISNAIRMQCNITLEGDSTGSTTIEQTSATANGITVLGPAGVNLGNSCSGALRNLTVEGTGHLGSGTLVEEDNAVGFTTTNLRIYNGGGRGMNLEGSSERNKQYNLHIDAVRWPLQLTHNANENQWMGLNISNPGQDASGYCWGAMCVNGQYPAFAPSNPAITSVSQTDSTHVTVTLNGTIPQGLQVGHYGAIAGVSEDASYNQSPLLITALTQVGSQYTVQMQETVSTAGPYTDGTWSIVWRPDIHQAVWVEAVDNWLWGGSIKSTQFQGCMGFHATENDGESDFYCEGFPYDGEPRVNSGFVANGVMPLTTTTAAMTTSSTSVPVASTMWFPDYINDTQDLGVCAAYTYILMPADAVAGSTATSTAFPSVTKGTQEQLDGCFSSDGAFHINARGQQPGNATYAWPAGSILERNVASDYGSGATIENNHTESIDAPSNAGFTTDCNDQSWSAGQRGTGDYPVGFSTCAEILVGKVPDTRIGNPNGASSGALVAGTNANINNNSIYTGGTESLGEGYIKAFNDAVIYSHTMPNSNPFLSQTQITAGSIPGTQVANSPYQNILYGSATGLGGLSTPDFAFSDNLTEVGDSHFYGLDKPNPNPGMNFSADGTQFTSSYCFDDAGTVVSAHSLTRSCFEGSPYFSGQSGAFVEQYWNGTTWVTENSLGNTSDTFNVPATFNGTLTANENINYVTGSASGSYTIPSGQEFTLAQQPGTITLPALSNGKITTVVYNGSGSITFAAPSGSIAYPNASGTGYTYLTSLTSTARGGYSFQVEGNFYWLLSAPVGSSPVPNLSVSNLTAGNCVQAGTGGALTTTTTPCVSTGTANTFSQTQTFSAGIQTGTGTTASWSSGSGAPSGPCTNGSLYSNQTGAAGSTLYDCVATAWVDVN